MKLTAFVTAIVFAASAFAGPVLADEVQHYRAKPSETLEEAVNNFSEYNKLLSEVLAKEELSQSDMERVHELSYTLEVALAKINEEMTGIVDTLEEVHLSSEQYNEAKLRGVGQVYLEIAQTVVK